MKTNQLMQTSTEVMESRPIMRGERNAAMNAGHCFRMSSRKATNATDQTTR
jgi:hypothetical protein